MLFNVLCELCPVGLVIVGESWFFVCWPLRCFGVKGDLDGEVVGGEVSEGVPCHVRSNGALCYGDVRGRGLLVLCSGKACW